MVGAIGRLRTHASNCHEASATHINPCRYKADSWASSGLNGQAGRFFAVEIFAGVVVRAKRGSPFRADKLKPLLRETLTVRYDLDI
jgi:hypothetical protein